MSNAVLTRIPDAAELAAMDMQHVAQLLRSQAASNDALRNQIEALRAQLEWFKRQVFGQKSERYAPQPDAQQMHLGEMLPVVAAASEEPTATVPEHKRRKARSDFTDDAASVPFFDEARVPVVSIEVPNPELQGLSAEQVAEDFEIVGQKVSHRLAQRPGAYVVLKYVRPVVKRRVPVDGKPTLHCPGAPAGVIEGSRADVSFIVGVMLDKFEWHLPLYRQHQRLIAAGFNLSRPWLTQLMQQAAQLLEPIYEAQLDSIRKSRVLAMDETPIKAGRAGPGKMRCGYFWPLYGEQAEVCFPFFESRQHGCVKALLGEQPPPGQVLLSDGYAAYSRYAQATGVTHAQCWSHTRRGFFEALGAAPAEADQALKMIGALYELEAEIRKRGLAGPAKRLHRLEHAKPRVEEFFAWVDEQFTRQGLLPSNALTKALAYARERRKELMVFLRDEDVPMDTNHLERALRPIPMGRRNWLFCWTEVSAKHTGIVQSLLATCRLHGIDPYTYFVDVLQRVGQHPASRVAELTPRLWKQHFAELPLRSDLHGAVA
jgi:transposase